MWQKRKRSRQVRSQSEKNLDFIKQKSQKVEALVKNSNIEIKRLKNKLIGIDVKVAEAEKNC